MKISYGSLYRRTKIYWFTVWVDGKKQNYSLETSNQREAENKVFEFRKQISLGLNPFDIKRDSSKATLGDLVSQYKTWSEHNKAARSRYRERSILARFVGHFKPTTPPGHLTRAALDQYFATMELHHHDVAEPVIPRLGETQLRALQPATRNRHLATIRHLYNKAVEWGICSANPAAHIRAFKTQKKPIRWLTDAEISKLITSAPNEFLKDLILTALETGLRGGEICRLAPADVDLAGGLITVHGTKSYQVRHVPISRRLTPVLQRRLAAGGERLFPIETDYLVHQVKKIAKDAELLDVTTHVFRHTYASRLIAAGVDLHTVQALLGHQSIQTTMIYAHLSPDRFSVVSEKLKKIYAGVKKKS